MVRGPGVRRGVLVVVCSPSGGGKTTLIRRVLARLESQGRPGHFSVSHTTRRPRSGEVEGVDYHFVARPEFEAMVARGELLEHAEYVGNLYGTARAEVDGRLESGTDVFLDIDVQGARQVKAALPEAVQVFLFPPSFEVLCQRLRGRGKDDPAAIRLRIRQALSEMREWERFDCVIINDRLEEAVAELEAIVVAARLRGPGRRSEVCAIIEEFERSAVEE